MDRLPLTELKINDFIEAIQMSVDDHGKD